MKNSPRRVVVAYWEERNRLIIQHTGFRSRERARLAYERSNAELVILEIWGGKE